jgi:hypothetical protein
MSSAFEATIPESIEPVEITIAESIAATMPNHVTNTIPLARARTATIPATITSIVTIDESIELFPLPLPPSSSLCEVSRRHRGQQH